MRHTCPPSRIARQDHLPNTVEIGSHESVSHCNALSLEHLAMERFHQFMTVGTCGTLKDLLCRHEILY